MKLWLNFVVYILTQCLV